MSEIGDLKVVDDQNTDRFPEFMPGEQVNNSARALEGILARWYKDTNGSLATTGSGGSYIVSTNRNITTLAAGLSLRLKFNHISVVANTLSVNAITGKSLLWADGDDVMEGELKAGQYADVVYDAVLDKFIVMCLCPWPAIGVYFEWPYSTLPGTRFIWADGSELSRTTAAKLYAVSGTTYGSGDGSTTFNVQDRRGAFGRMLDQNAGRDEGRTLSNELQPHMYASHTHEGSVVVALAPDHSHYNPHTHDFHHIHQYSAAIGSNQGGPAGGVLGRTDGYPTTGPLYADNVTPRSNTGGPNEYAGYTQAAGTHQHGTVLTIDTAGGTETRPINFVTNYIVRWK